MEIAIVTVILTAAVSVVGLKSYRAWKGRPGCGCASDKPCPAMKRPPQ